ncbi:Predicted phosphoribosyltransferase [Pseudonocardia thermophila]|jgi:Predicted phosphoribosyltransferases|uniref:Predicted phosphoribosyltransferase n=1 Tax=Pseudonocardia thermophila TaxID=1848 RepID=A0A1M6XMN6_PSETH|nr:phosphoribosyltransferase family protein [Pseudonocardia thermophila]SHL07237.1 Predicted phosphoribosyltransferase [Pseudonocardia thermophila]
MELFIDRADAGRRLADVLGGFAGEDLVVLGLPRGGVAVAYEVARALDAPLDVVLVRKVGVPRAPELAMGAVGEHGVVVRNEDVLSAAGIDEAVFELGVRVAQEQVERRARAFRGDRPAPDLTGRTVLLVDDGIATGATARAACRIVRAQQPARLVLATPVAAPAALAALRAEADEVVCLAAPRHFGAVGQFYVDFTATADEEVADLLQRAAERYAGGVGR